MNTVAFGLTTITFPADKVDYSGNLGKHLHAIPRV